MSYAAALFDVDGTLVDSNDPHAHAWVEALAGAGITVEFASVRRCIGMGGDKLLPAVAGISADSPRGQGISQRRSEIFREKYLPHLEPFRDADRLVAAMKARGMTVVAASSANKDDLRALLKVARVEALLDDAASSDDAEESKPEPDIVHAALRRARAKPHEAVMIGDTPYDIEAATRADVDAIAFRCGGWSDADLKGAIAIYDGPWDLLDALRGRGPTPC